MVTARQGVVRTRQYPEDSWLFFFHLSNNETLKTKVVEGLGWNAIPSLLGRLKQGRKWKVGNKTKSSHWKENLIMLLNLFFVLPSKPMQHSLVSWNSSFHKENCGTRAEPFQWDQSRLLLSSGSCSRADDKPGTQNSFVCTMFLVNT